MYCTNSLHMGQVNGTPPKAFCLTAAHKQHNPCSSERQHRPTGRCNMPLHRQPLLRTSCCEWLLLEPDLKDHPKNLKEMRKDVYKICLSPYHPTISCLDNTYFLVICLIPFMYRYSSSGGLKKWPPVSGTGCTDRYWSSNGDSTVTAIAFLQHYVMHPVSFRCEVAPKSRLRTAQSYQTILVGTAPSDNTQNAPMGSVYTGTVGGCQ